MLKPSKTELYGIKPPPKTKRPPKPISQNNVNEKFTLTDEEIRIIKCYRLKQEMDQTND